ncbi:unnamed protein product [Symbiodinium sp. CCMP2592]|nr:unnamed protein product [Symbiodinium sp. CCMP2592]
MALTFGQPSAGTGQLAWTRPYESAMEAFAKAQSQLEAQLAKKPRDPDAVKFFEGKLEDARKDKEFAQTMLQQCQAAPRSEDILTQIEKLLEKKLEHSNEKLEMKLEHSSEKLEKKLEPLWEAMFVPVAKSVRTVETDVEVRQACVEHHGKVKECLILRHLHGKSAK